MTALMGLGLRLRLAKLHLICDARGSLDELESFARAAFMGGCDMIQLRDARLSTAELAKALDVLSKAATTTQGLVVSNDVAAASACRGDVVHLGAPEGPAAEAKATLHPWALVGRSADSSQQLRAAAADDDVDYIFVGAGGYGAAEQLLPPFATPERSKPWFAVGGINADTIGEVVSQGARRVCVSRAITLAEDPETAARGLKTSLVQAWADDPASEAYLLSVFPD